MKNINTLFAVIGLSTLSALGISAQENQTVQVTMPGSENKVISADTVAYRTADATQQTSDYGKALGIENYDKLPPDALLPISRKQAEELIAKMIVVSRAPSVEARRRAEIVNDFKVEQLKKRLLEQALRKTYADEYQHRLDRMENLLLLILATGNNKIDPAVLHNFIMGGNTPAGSTMVLPGAASLDPNGQLNNLTNSDGTAIAMAPGAKAASWEHFLSQVFFKYDSSVLTTDGKKVLDNVVGWLAENDNVELSLRGYASSEGKISYNNKLSARRVNAVANYLSSKGVSKSRLHIIPAGVDTMKEEKSTFPDARRVDIRPHYGE